MATADISPETVQAFVQIAATSPMAVATLLGFWLISRALERVLREKADGAIRAVVGLTIVLRKAVEKMGAEFEDSGIREQRPVTERFDEPRRQPTGSQRRVGPKTDPVLVQGRGSGRGGRGGG